MNKILKSLKEDTSFCIGEYVYLCIPFGVIAGVLMNHLCGFTFLAMFIGLIAGVLKFYLHKER